MSRAGIGGSEEQGNANASSPSGVPMGDIAEYSRNRYGTGGDKRARKARSRASRHANATQPPTQEQSKEQERPEGQLTERQVQPRAQVQNLPQVHADEPVEERTTVFKRAESPLSENVLSGAAERGETPASQEGAANLGDASHRPTVEELYPERARTRKKGRRIRRVLAVVGAVLLVVLLAGGAYAFWFMHSLDNELAPDDDTMAKLDEVLVPTLSGDPFYMLLLGSDSREGGWSWTEAEMGDNERSDVMILARVDPKHKKLTLLTIPRDTPYKKADGTYQKINEVYNDSGVAGSIKAVSELTGVDISHYAEVHISGLEAVVDLLGGVSVDIPIKLSYNTTDQVDITLEPGRQTINGQQAQIFARCRHEYGENQEAHRQDAVRQLLIAIIEKTLSKPISELPGVVLEEASYIDTDLKSVDVVSLAMSFATGSGDITVYTGTGPSDGDTNPEADGQWLCFENPEGWAKVMEVVDAGEDPSGMDFSDTSIPWPAEDEASKKEDKES